MRYRNFAEFYPFYLGEHRDQTCRRLHVIGTSLMTLYGLQALLGAHPADLLWMPLIGYGFAWVGHFFFEHNRPATFSHPLYSLLGDFVMTGDVLRGRLPW